MKKLRISDLQFLCFFAIILLCASCNKIEDEKSSPNVKLITDIGIPNTISSRYTGNDVDNVTFTKGDIIGVFIEEKDLTKWTFNVDWSPENAVIWKDKINNYKFSAFSPYSENSTYENVLLPDLSSQEGDLANLSKYDFMVAEKTQNYNHNGVVEFTGANCFMHKCCLICLNIENKDDLENSIITKLEIQSDKIGNKTSYSFNDYLIKSLSTQKDINTISLKDNIDLKSGNKTIYLVVPSISISKTVTLNINYQKDGKTVPLRYENFADNLFERNKEKMYTIRIKDNAIKIENPTISQWDVDGEAEYIEME